MKKQINKKTFKEKLYKVSKRLVVLVSILGLIGYYSFTDTVNLMSAKLKKQKYVTMIGRAEGIGVNNKHKVIKEEQKKQENSKKKSKKKA